jgi:hypothetical protein
VQIVDNASVVMVPQHERHSQVHPFILEIKFTYILAVFLNTLASINDERLCGLLQTMIICFAHCK